MASLISKRLTAKAAALDKVVANVKSAAFQDVGSSESKGQSNAAVKDNECLICREVLDSTGINMRTCSHQFHAKCIMTTWLKTGAHVCPLCRADNLAKGKTCTLSAQEIARKRDSEEFLLRENPQRFVLFPLKYPDMWEMYKKHLALFWVASEVDLTEDLPDWKALRKEEREFLKMVLAFFAASDGIVLENLGERFLTEVQIPEARCFYAFQMAMENVHSETYSLLIDTYVQDTKEKAELFNALETKPSIKRKGKWAQRWIESDEACFAERLVAFAAIEGIFFSGSFCAIFWMKSRGLLKGLSFSNELISRDEALHTDFACLLYHKLKRKLTDKRVHQIVKEGCDIEKMFVCDALPWDLPGMNAKLMSQHIEYCADRLLVALGHSKLYNSDMPFDFLETISLPGKTNIHERRNADYNETGVMASLSGNTNDNHTFAQDDDEEY